MCVCIETNKLNNSEISKFRNDSHLLYFLITQTPSPSSFTIFCTHVKHFNHYQAIFKNYWFCINKHTDTKIHTNIIVFKKNIKLYPSYTTYELLFITEFQKMVQWKTLSSNHREDKQLRLLYIFFKIFIVFLNILLKKNKRIAELMYNIKSHETI